MTVKCPKCGCEIDHLTAYSLEENQQDVELDDDYTLTFGETEVVECSCKRIQFCCPICHKVLFENKGDCEDDRVIDFLETGEYPTNPEKVEFT